MFLFLHPGHVVFVSLLKITKDFKNTQGSGSGRNAGLEIITNNRS